MQECVRETDSGKKDFLLSVSEQIMAQGLVIVTFESPGSIQIAQIHIVRGRGMRGEVWGEWRVKGHAPSLGGQG